jgi:CheY-like chemotaxis protein/DNA-binding XRE family transcriptional regulator
MYEKEKARVSRRSQTTVVTLGLLWKPPICKIAVGRLMTASQITSRFGASVRRLRYRLDITQESLAERAGLHRTYIAGIEGGARNVSLKCIEKLARGLEVSPDTLLLHASGRSGRGEPSGTGSSTREYVDILMVEDNRDDVELTLRAFKQARIANSLQVAHDGREALDFLFCAGRFAGRKMEDRPHLVLLDLNLPKIGGMEVLRRIKADKRTQSIPVVVLTASRAGQDLAECLRLGAEGYIIKPVDFQTLSQATPQLNLDWALLKPPAAESREVPGSVSA